MIIDIDTVFTQPRLTFRRVPTAALAYGTLTQRLFSPTAAAAATIKGAAASVCSSNGNAIIQRWGIHPDPDPTPISTPNRRRLPDPAIHAKGDLGRAATAAVV